MLLKRKNVSKRLKRLMKEVIREKIIKRREIVRVVRVVRVKVIVT